MIVSGCEVLIDGIDLVVQVFLVDWKRLISGKLVDGVFDARDIIRCVRRHADQIAVAFVDELDDSGVTSV